MATQTKVLWSSFDPVSKKTASISFNWDDVNRRILSFTALNPTTKRISFSATAKNNSKNYSGTIPPNTASTTITMTSGVQNRLDISVTPSGKLDGVEYSINYG